MSHKVLIVLLCLGVHIALISQPTENPLEIKVWYGEEQDFGQPGRAQRWVNVLGNVTGAGSEAVLTYALNHGPAKSLTIGSDLHRLARSGDFNVELSWEDLSVGSNLLVISVKDAHGSQERSEVLLNIHEDRPWSIPYQVDFSKVGRLQQVVQIADGLWELTSDGVRTAEPYYDRVLMMGDTNWTDYEAVVSLTIHDWTPPEPGPPTYNVSHFGVAMRWRGHHQDDRQPSRKWYPLGAQGEFLLRGDSTRWRILFDGSGNKPAEYAEGINLIEAGDKIMVRTQVETMPDGRSRYRFKQWVANHPEPELWDVEGLESDDYPSGALCLVPHNSDVTIHHVKVSKLMDK